ncbi:MAG TPA: MgtC/SapB family protein [Dysgonamonadaceae bacterium]|nr:MgtC/SapB family protein [Dysgonamonadaceae bacterium]
MTITTFVLRLLASIVAGGLVGLERQYSNKSAGFRTNTLVAMGACIYVLINVTLTKVGGDPTRIIGQIVTGIGFLGAGVILHHGGSIQGLTTAATIWCSAALGSLAGLGLYWETLICTIAIIIVNTTFKADRFLSKYEKKEEKPPFNPEEDS